MECRHSSRNHSLRARIASFAFLAAACAVFLGSCPKSGGIKALPSPSETGPLKLEPLPGGLPPSQVKAVIAYQEGQASAIRSGARETIEMGDEILPGDTIETGPNSRCEIRLGNASTVRLEENTTLVFNSLFLGETSSRVDLSLRVGVLLNKVEKLLDSDAYVIRGPSMVCGVRGTRFALSADAAGATLLAVESGKVKALPASAALDRIADAATANGVARAALKAVLSLGPEVGPGMELSFGQKDIAAAEKAYGALEKIIASTPPETAQDSDAPAGLVPVKDVGSTESANAIISKGFAAPAAGFGKPLAATEKTKVIFGGFERMERPSPSPAAPKPLDPAILGQYEAGGRPIVGEIVQFKGLVLLSNSDGEVAAYDQDGKRVWRAKTDNPGSKHSYPMVYKDKVYYSGTKSFCVIDGKTGAILRETPFSADDPGRDGLRPYQYTAGILSPRANGIDLIDPESSDKLDRVEVPEGLMMSPVALKSKAIVYVTTTGLFRLVNPSDKSVIKEIQTQARGISQQSLRNRGSLYFFADATGMAVLVDADSGEALWQRRVDGASTAEAEMGKAAVYLPTESGLVVIGLSDGEIVRVIPGISGPPLLSNDDLFLCTDSGELIVARADPYTELTRISLPFVGSARPLIVGKSLWVAGRGGKIVRIDPELIKRRAKAGS
jgi:hypothetical protein